jgi:Tfp pilus assembly protein PilF
MAAGNDEEALKTYRRANELYPNLASVLNNLAWLLAKNPDTVDQALHYAQSAASIQPFRASARDTLGWVYYQKGDYSDAKEQLDKAVLFDSLNPSIRYHRGMTHLKLGEKIKALQDFREAASSSVPFPEKVQTDEMIGQLG